MGWKLQLRWNTQRGPVEEHFGGVAQPLQSGIDRLQMRVNPINTLITELQFDSLKKQKLADMARACFRPCNAMSDEA